MKSMQNWLDEYGESHQNPLNKKILWICVPAIMILLYYIRLSLVMAVGMFIIGFALLAGNSYIDTNFETPLWKTSLIIFVVAWIGQFIGHKIEGKKPSFFQDLQFLLIGPAWLLSFIYNKFGIKY